MESQSTKSTKDAAIEQPLANVVIQKFRENGVAEQPLANVVTQQPQEIGDADQQPLANVVNEQSQENDVAEQPLANVVNKQLQENGVAEQLLANAVNQRSMKNVAKAQPQERGVAKPPPQNVVNQQPPQQRVYAQPMRYVYQQPPQQRIYEQPVQYDVYQQPPQQRVYEQPVQYDVYQQPFQCGVCQQSLQRGGHQRPVQYVCQQPLQSIQPGVSGSHKQPLQYSIYEHHLGHRVLYEEPQENHDTEQNPWVIMLYKPLKNAASAADTCSQRSTTGTDRQDEGGQRVSVGAKPTSDPVNQPAASAPSRSCDVTAAGGQTVEAGKGVEPAPQASQKPGNFQSEFKAHDRFVAENSYFRIVRRGVGQPVPARYLEPADELVSLTPDQISDLKLGHIYDSVIGCQYVEIVKRGRASRRVQLRPGEVLTSFTPDDMRGLVEDELISFMDRTHARIVRGVKGVKPLELKPDQEIAYLPPEHEELLKVAAAYSFCTIIRETFVRIAKGGFKFAHLSRGARAIRLKPDQQLAWAESKEDTYQRLRDLKSTLKVDDEPGVTGTKTQPPKRLIYFSGTFPN